MSFQKAIFISFGVGTALALGACGAQDTTSTGTGGVSVGGASGVPVTGTGGVVPTAGGTSGGGAPAGGAPAGGMTAAAGTGSGAAPAGGPGTTCATTNFAGYMPNAAQVSFTTDLLPMFGLSCVTSDCHNSADNSPRAMLKLGHKCAYDANAKWKCTFPPAPADPNDLAGMPAPDDMATVTAIYQNLVMAPATTVNGGAMKRVAPGDPAHSFLMLKLGNKQNASGLACTNQDPSHGTGAPCGDSMPLNADPWCDGSTRPKFDAIAQWIANGAPMN